MSTQPFNREDKRCIRTRQAIKSALLTLLKDKPLIKITISELAAAADVNRKTFYNHYTDLNCVLDELEKELLDRICGAIGDENAWSIIIKPDYFFEKLFGIIDEDLETYRLLVQSGEHVQLLNGFRKRINDAFGHQVLGRANADPVRLSLLMDFVSAGLSALFEYWAKNSGSMTIDEMTRFASMVVTGAARPVIDEMFHKQGS